MSINPYKSQTDIAFWSKSISNGFDPNSLITTCDALFKKNDLVTSAGSCFASNLVPYIESAGLTYLRTEKIPGIFSQLGENLGYANFSAAYGNVYTARQLLQLYQRALGTFVPKEDRWQIENSVIDPFRPGLKFPAASNEEFDLLTKSHLRATREAFENADVFVFTLGLTEGWVSKADASTYPSCPGTIAGNFDSKKYEFKNFTVNEIVDDVSTFIELLRNRNPKVRFIISVSPVPLVATATKNHVLTSTIYSKSVLRVAAEEISSSLNKVTYFPAFEIITGPQAPHDFFEEDRRNVSKKGIEVVMATLLSASGLTYKNSISEDFGVSKIVNTNIEELSKRIATADCDEVMLDDSI